MNIFTQQRWKSGLYSLALLLSLFGFSSEVMGQFVTMNGSGTASENFNNLTAGGPYTQGTTSLGWYYFNGNTSLTAISNYEVKTGTQTSGSWNSLNNVASGIDKAFGASISNAFTQSSAGSVYHIYVLKNTGTTNITACSLGYTLEQYRKDASANSFVVEYSIRTELPESTTVLTGSYTSVTALNATAPIASTGGAALDGNLTANRVVRPLTSLGTLTIAPDEYLWIRFRNGNVSGNDGIIAIDDVSASWTAAAATPGTFALTEGASAVTSGSTVNFGSAEQNITTTKTFTLTNAAAGSITGITATLTGANASEYEITTTPNTPLASSANTTVAVRYNRANQGTHNVCTLNIAGTNASNTPYTVILNGSATAPTTGTINLLNGASTIANGGTYAYGSATQNTTATNTFTVTNTGIGTLTGLSVALGGTNASEFEISTPLGTTSLVSGASTTFTIRYKRATISANHTGTFTVTASNVSNSNYVVNLTGTSTDATPVATPFTNSETLLSFNSATFNGTRTDANSPTVSAQGFVYMQGIVANLTAATSGAIIETVTPVSGAYSKAISNLLPSTQYTYRAFTVVSNGCACTTYSSNAIGFTTLKAAPATNPVIGNITRTTNTATIEVASIPSGVNGVVVFINNTNSFTDPTNGILGSANLAYSGSGQQLVNAVVNPTGTYTTGTITGLSEGATYYIAVYAYNNTGTNILYNTEEGTGQFTTNSTLVSLTAVNNAYIQNFDGMTSTTLPTGWKGQFAASTSAWAAMSTAVSQQANTGSPTAGGTYRFGVNSTFDDVAVGAMTSGSFASPNRFVLGMVNNTGFAISRIEYSFDLEKYRQNTAAASCVLAYSTNGSTFIDIPGTFTSSNTPLFVTGSSSYNFVTPGSETKTGVFDFPTAIAAGGQLYFRITLATTGGSSQAIAIDNFSLTPKAAAPEIKVSANAAQFNLTSPRTVNFGARNLNITSDSTFTISNIGTAALTGVSATLSNTTDFELVSTPSASVAIGANTTFIVRAKRARAGTQTGNLTIASNDPLNPSIVIPLSTDAFSGSSVIALDAFTSSNISTVGIENFEISVFRFKISDDEGNPSADALATSISQITIKQGAGNTVSDFTSLLAGARLYSNGNFVSGTINPTTLVFSGLDLPANNTLGLIADNATRLYNLRIIFRSDLTPAEKAVVDNLQFVFEVSNADVVTLDGFSQIANSSANSGTPYNKIDIIADKHSFFTQPVDGEVGVALPTVVIAAEDFRGFRDLDVNRGFQISGFGIGTFFPNMANGLLELNSLVYASPQADIVIDAVSSSSGLPSIASNTFSVRTPTPAASYFKYKGPNGGSLNVPGHWEASPNGVGYVPATRAPNNSAIEVRISGNKSAVMNAAFACSKLIIDEGCTLSTNGNTLTINDISTGSVSELEINGLLAGNLGSGLSLANGVSVNVNNGGTLRLANAGTNANLFTSTTGVTFNLADNSTLEILGVASTTPPDIAAVFSSVGNLKFESIHGSSMNFAGTRMPLNIRGNLEIVAPTDLTDEIRMSNATAYTLNIAGNLVVSQGAFNGSANSSGAKAINVNGNVVVGENARFYFETGSSNTLNIGGGLSLASGASMRATSAQNYNLNFIGNTSATISMAANVGEIVRFNVSKTGSGKLSTTSNIRVGTLTFGGGTIETRAQDTVIVGTAINNETALTGIIGNAQITQTASQNQNRTFGNLGIEINATGANPGQFKITRTTGNNAVVTDPNNASNVSAKRRFKIEGYNNAGSLNATVKFSYLTEELNGIPAANVTMARSTDNGTTWLRIPQSQVSLNTVEGSVTLTGINTFSDWTFQDDQNAPLPVRFAYVNGKRSLAGNVLSFATATEINNKGFEVQRALDGKNFETIGFINGAGTSNKMNTYQFIDATFSSAYYRLNQVDFDGTASLSPVVYISGEAQRKLSVQVAPNPISEHSLLIINTDEPNLLASITDAKGGLIGTQQGTATELSTWFQAQAKRMGAGVFVLRVSGSQESISVKLVK